MLQKKPTKLALYRLVTQDAHSFPELGRRYREQVIERSHDVFVHYLTWWVRVEKWKIRDEPGAAKTFAAPLGADIF